MSPTTLPRRSLVAVLALAAAACGEPLKSPQLLEEPRVIGARVEVDGEPLRATPAPGEGATARLLVGYPGAPAAMTSALVLCPCLPTATGVPTCAGPPYAVLVTATPTPAAPALHFTLPDAAAMVGLDRALLLALLCPEGVPQLGASLIESHCSAAGVRPLRASLEILLFRDGAENRNPDLDAASVTLDGEPWRPAPATAVAGATCAGEASLPVVAAGSGEHQFALALASSDREETPSENPLDPPREAIQLSFLTTAGALAHPYAVVEAAATDAVVEIAWEAPAEAAAGGEIARVYFVARDFRGGVGWAERALCIAP